MKDNRQKIILVLVLAAALLLFWGGGKYQAWKAAKENAVTIIADDELDLATPPAEPEVAQIVVHIAGSVQNPGVYTMSQGDRVEDALERAGLAADAAPDLLNRAQLLTDGQKIVVPNQADAQTLAANDTLTATGGTQSDKVSLNSADKAQLMTLPGIGEVKAQAIIDYRQKNGPFESLEEVKNVKGIGDKTFEGLADLISL